MMLVMPGGSCTICKEEKYTGCIETLCLCINCSSYKKKLEFQCVASQIRGLVRTQLRVSNSAFQCVILDRHFSCN